MTFTFTFNFACVVVLFYTIDYLLGMSYYEPKHVAPAVCLINQCCVSLIVIDPCTHNAAARITSGYLLQFIIVAKNNVRLVDVLSLINQL